MHCGVATVVSANQFQWQTGTVKTRIKEQVDWYAYGTHSA